MFPGSGHALFLDDPERFNGVVADVLRSLSTIANLTFC